MSRRRARRSVSRGPKNNVWSVILIDEQTVDTSSIEGDIVNAGDLQAPLSGFQRFTLLRIRGWLSITKAVANTTSAAIFMVIYTTDADAAVIDTRVADNYTDEDILWTGGVAFAANGAGAVEQSPGVQFDIDVKAMRKIDTSRDVRFSFTSTAVGAIVVSGLLRALVRKGGN